MRTGTTIETSTTMATIAGSTWRAAVSRPARCSAVAARNPAKTPPEIAALTVQLSTSAATSGLATTCRVRRSASTTAMHATVAKAA